MWKKAYLGVDVSKGYADLVLFDGECKILEHFFQLADTHTGRTKLKDLIEQWKKNGMEELYCGVESTGGYENNWHSFLKGLQSMGGIWVSRLNAKAVKSVSDASLKRTITDCVSAENIASYLIKFPEKVDYGLKVIKIDEQFKDGRSFMTSLVMWTKQKVQLGNQLEKLLYQHLSELLVYCRHGIPGWLLRMLVEYPCAKEIKAAGVKKLARINGLTEEKAVAILNKISQSESSAQKVMQHLISLTAKEILHKQALIETNKAYLNDIYKDDSSVKLLTEIKGIGLDSAVSLVLEIENVNRFDDAKKMASYFGVHPTFKQSGDGFWGNHMSKKGRGHIRAVLYMIALSAVRYNPMFKTLYARFRAKGMTHKQAAGVVMHKMLRVIYGVLKSGKSFDPATEEKHRKQADQKQQTKKTETKTEKESFEQKKQRFQTISEEAPISGRNLKTRKKQLASQAPTGVNAGSPTADANI